MIWLKIKIDNMGGPFKMKGFPMQQGTASYKSATPYQSAFKALVMKILVTGDYE